MKGYRSGVKSGTRGAAQTEAGAIRRAYRALGAESALQVDFFSGGHVWEGRQAYPLLERVLQPQA